MSWRDGPGQAAAVAEALRLAKTKKEAAQRLGMSRMHLYRLINRRDGVTMRDGVTSSDARMRGEGGDAVTPTLIPPLTYGRPTPTFRSVDTEANAEVRELSVEIPMELYDWLDDEAHLRKRAERRPRPAKSPIVVEALRRLRDDLERQRRDKESGK